MLTNEDTQTIMRYGRLYMSSMNKNGGKESQTYLSKAAYLYAIADDGQDKRRMLWWWTEGTRDYSYSQYNIEKAENSLIEAARMMAKVG